MPIITNNGTGQALLKLDNTYLNTTSTAFTTMKYFYFSDLDKSIKKILPIVSVWSATSSAMVTVKVSIDNTVSASASTNSTGEVLMKFPELIIPQSPDIHTFQVNLKTSNASYAAYTQLLEVVGR